MGAEEKIKQLGNIAPGKTIHFWYDGSWSMHQLLDYILSFTGPAKVLLTAFSINEESVRKLLLLKESGKITELKCLFNDQLKRFKADLLAFSSNVADEIRFIHCHAKVFLIEGANMNVMVISSANLTRGDRYEAGTICCVESDFQQMKLSIMLTWQFANNYD